MLDNKIFFWQVGKYNIKKNTTIIMISDEVFLRGGGETMSKAIKDCNNLTDIIFPRDLLQKDKSWVRIGPAVALTQRKQV